jgi:hypothetical protein
MKSRSKPFLARPGYINAKVEKNSLPQSLKNEKEATCLNLCSCKKGNLNLDIWV